MKRKKVMALYNKISLRKVQILKVNYINNHIYVINI